VGVQVLLRAPDAYFFLDGKGLTAGGAVQPWTRDGIRGLAWDSSRRASSKQRGTLPETTDYGYEIKSAAFPRPSAAAGLK
jgi:hypothetical protein